MRVKKSFLVILLLIIFFLGITVIFINSKKLKLEYNEIVEVSLKEEIYNLDNVKIKNGEILSEKVLIDTSKIGEVNVKILVKDYFGKNKDFVYKVIVKDTEKPIIKYDKVIEIFEGENVNLIDKAEVSDNSSENIDLKIEGEYNMSKAGEYHLYYVAKDSSGNEAKEEFVLKVKAKENNNDINLNNPTNNNNNKENNNSNANTTKDPTEFTTKKGFKGITKNGITYIDGYLVVNKTYSLPSNYGNALTSETTKNFNKMKSAATLDGLNIYISSGFRSYNTQNRLYNNYVNKDGKANADTYSARAGHSEHQSGLAFDVNIINDTFANTPEAKWLAKNCYKYGFILRYPKGKSSETGYKYEPWHFRYVGNDLASKLYNNGDWLTMEDYFGITSVYSS